MPNVTIRDIPEDILNKIKVLSQKERRSINNELLLIIEYGLRHYMRDKTNVNNNISKDTQLSIWSNLSGKWEDTRETDEIIGDIYKNRTKGRNIEL